MGGPCSSLAQDSILFCSYMGRFVQENQDLYGLMVEAPFLLSFFFFFIETSVD